MAGFDRGVPEADRPAARSGFVRRRRRRFIRRRRPVAPRVRVLPEAHGDRVDCIAHRKRVGGADEASRLHELGRARRRLGRRRHHRLGAMQPEGLLGIHLNTQYAFPAQIPDTLSPEQRYAVETLALYTGDLGGSNHLQGTKPETVGFALADSPAGQAAWIYDKFQSKTDNHGLAEDALSRDDMLDAISLYWFTNSAASSARIYWENKSGTFAGPKLTLPFAVTAFPRAIPRLPRSWIEDPYSNLIHYGEADKGGHFAALEQPEILVSEIRTGLRTLRS